MLHNFDFAEFMIFLAFAVPIVTIIAFLICLIRWLRCPKDSPMRKQRRTAALTSGGIALFLGGTMIILIILFTISLYHM